MTNEQFLALPAAEQRAVGNLLKKWITLVDGHSAKIDGISLSRSSSLLDTKITGDLKIAGISRNPSLQWESEERCVAYDE